MKKLEILAYSLEEAKQKAFELGITVTKNVTPSWKKEKCPINDKEFKEFAVQMLDKNRLTDIEGAGLIIALDAGSKDTRKRSYKFINNIIKGKRRVEKVVELRLASGKVIGEAVNQGQAAKLGKKLMAEYREDIIAVITPRIADGKGVAFTLEYTPSASAKEGKYIVFGNEKSF